MSRADGVLVVVLTRKWFDMIERGEKLEEYRKDKPGRNTWGKRLIATDALRSLLLNGIHLDEFFCDRQKHDLSTHFHPYHTLRAFDGYRADRRVLERRIRSIRWGTPRPEWSGDTVTGPCFVFSLEDTP